MYNIGKFDTAVATGRNPLLYKEVSGNVFFLEIVSNNNVKWSIQVSFVELSVNPPQFRSHNQSERFPDFENVADTRHNNQSRFLCLYALEFSSALLLLLCKVSRAGNSCNPCGIY